MTVLPADASDSQTRPEVVVGHVAVGRYVLVLGDRAGTAIVPVASRAESRTLTHAIEQAPREHEPPPAGSRSLTGFEDDVSQATSKAERAVSLFTEIAQGRLDPSAISDELDALVDLLGRLDRDEHWREALHVARSLAMLLALLGRWLELLDSLRAALSAAKQLENAGGQAWALHELGTLHGAAGDHTEAERLLGQAHELRIGDPCGLKTTDRNREILSRPPQPPQTLWRTLEQILRRPLWALLFTILLLIVGGVAGAVIRGLLDSSESGINQLKTVKIDFAPAAPLPGEQVAFHASVEGAVDHAHYSWRFGDGKRSSAPDPTHAYRREHTYTAIVTVTDKRGIVVGQATRAVLVQRLTPINGTSSTGTIPGPSTKTLSVTTAGAGSGIVTSSDGHIDCRAACSHAYVSGAALTLAAVPAAGSTFTGWSGACSGTEACQLTLSANESVTATFAPAPVTLSVATTGAGSGTVTSSDEQINCGTACSHAYTPGTAVTLAAVPAAGSTFTGWSGACSGTEACQLTLSANESVAAEFTIIKIE